MAEYSKKTAAQRDIRDVDSAIDALKNPQTIELNRTEYVVIEKDALDALIRDAGCVAAHLDACMDELEEIEEVEEADAA